MNPTLDWLNAAEKQIRLTLESLRPRLLESQGHIEHQLKDDKTAVTEMDLLVENTLRDKLAEFDNSVAFCGEETGVNYDQPTFWLVDPIDGTEPFIRGLPFSTNSIALMDGGQPVMAIVYNFVLDEYYLAIKGQGATLGGHPIKVSSRPMAKAAVTVMGRLPDEDRCHHSELRRQVRMIAAMNTTSFELAAVARGAFDGTILINTISQPWDYAAGALIIKEAGGRVESIAAPGKLDCLDNRLVAANQVIFDQLMEFAQAMLAYGPVTPYNVPKDGNA